MYMYFLKYRPVTEMPQSHVTEDGDDTLEDGDPVFDDEEDEGED